jgi:hypothetical protein
MRYATANMFAEGNPAVIRPPMSQLMWWFSLLTHMGPSHIRLAATVHRRSFAAAAQPAEIGGKLPFRRLGMMTVFVADNRSL